MNKKIWKGVSVFFWILAVYALILQVQQLLDNHAAYDALEFVKPSLSRSWVSYAVLYYLIALIACLLVFVLVSILTNKMHGKLFIIILMVLLVSKFIVQAILRVCISVEGDFCGVYTTTMITIWNSLDKNNNLVFVYSEFSNYFASNTILATEVIPISWAFFGLFLGYTNRKYFVIVAGLAVALTAFIAFGTFYFNSPYFTTGGVFSVLCVGLGVLSYALNGMAIPDPLLGEAL